MVYRFIFFLFLLFVWKKESLKANKHKQQTKEGFAHKNISNEMLLNWQLSPALGGENSLCCSLVVSVLQILCFYTLSYRLIGQIILYLGRCL